MGHSALHQEGAIPANAHGGGVLWYVRAGWTDRAARYFHKGGDADPEERIRLISEQTRHFKDTGQAIGAASIMGLTRWAPPTLHALAARLTVRQRFANTVVTNIPGPQVPLYLMGARLQGMYPLMNLTETMALMVAITSLSGNMGFGFTGDWDAVPDIEEFPDYLQAAMSDLKKAAGV